MFIVKFNVSNDSYFSDGYSLETFFISNLGILYLVRTQIFPKNQHFLPPDTHVRFSENFTYVLNKSTLKIYLE